MLKVKRLLKRFKKEMIVAFLIIAFSYILTGCNFNPLARKYGGDITVNLKEGEKLINATWKADSLWLLTRPMKENETPDIYYFKEDSAFGILEGTVTIIEHKKDDKK